MSTVMPVLDTLTVPSLPEAKNAEIIDGNELLPIVLLAFSRISRTFVDIETAQLSLDVEALRCRASDLS